MVRLWLSQVDLSCFSYGYCKSSVSRSFQWNRSRAASKQIWQDSHQHGITSWDHCWTQRLQFYDGLFWWAAQYQQNVRAKWKCRRTYKCWLFSVFVSGYFRSAICQAVPQSSYDSWLLWSLSMTRGITRMILNDIVWTASLAIQMPSAMKGLGMVQRAQLLKKSAWPLNLTCDKDPLVTHKKVG